MTAPDPRSDEELVAAYVAGERAAFDRLVERYRRRVYGVCLRYFGDPGDAEDAAQDTFVALLRRAGTFRGGAAFSTWLFRVTTNACHDLARRRARRPPLAWAEPAEQAQPGPDQMANLELGVDLERALALLDADSRTAVILHDVRGLPYEDVAARLAMPVGTVKSRIHRGHARLAAALGAGDTPRAGAAHATSPPHGPGEPGRPSGPPTLSP